VDLRVDHFSGQHHDPTLEAFPPVARPVPLTVGTTDVGKLRLLLGEDIQQAAPLHRVHVPDRGSAPAATDLLAGAIDAALVNISAAAPHVRSGLLPWIAFTLVGTCQCGQCGTKQRSAALK
jgi:hypothetical protein